jgi:hypothetical protein
MNVFVKVVAVVSVLERATAKSVVPLPLVYPEGVIPKKPSRCPMLQGKNNAGGDEAFQV